MARGGSGLRVRRWIGVWGLGFALFGCDEPQNKERPTAQVSKQEIAACSAHCEELAKAELPTCSKPVLEPQACHKAVRFAEEDCKALCDPSPPPPGE